MTAQRQAAPVAHAVATSLTVSFPEAVLPGSLVVVCVYSTAPGPGYPPDFFGGLGGTWHSVSENEFWLAYSADVTGGTDVVLHYPFAEHWVALAVELTGAPTPHQDGGANGMSETGTIDVSVGMPDVRAGWLSVCGWVLPAASTTPTFTDTNGAYTVNADVADGVDVELAWADVPAAGATRHIGHRSDSGVVNGGYLFFGPGPAFVLAADEVVPPQLVIPMAELDEFGSGASTLTGRYLGASRWESLVPFAQPAAPLGGSRGLGLLKGPYLRSTGYEGYFVHSLATDDAGAAYGLTVHESYDPRDDPLIPALDGSWHSAGVRLGPIGRRERLVSIVDSPRGDEDWETVGFQDGRLLTMTSKTDDGSDPALIAHWRRQSDYAITDSVDATAARDAIAADPDRNIRLFVPPNHYALPFVGRNVVCLNGQVLSHNTSVVGLWDLAHNSLVVLGDAADWLAGVDGLDNSQGFFASAAYSPGENKIVVYGRVQICDFPAAAEATAATGTRIVNADALVVLDADDYHLVDVVLVHGEYTTAGHGGSPDHVWVEPGIFPDHRSYTSNTVGVSGPIVDPTNDRYAYISRQWDAFPAQGYNVTAPRTWSTGSYGRSDHKRLTITAFYRVDLRDIHAAPQLVVWLEHPHWDASEGPDADHSYWWYASDCGVGPGWLFPDPVTFDTVVQTRPRGKLIPPLHIPKPGLVPDGLLPPAAPTPPPPPPPPPGLWYATPDNSDVHDADGFSSDGFYNGAYLRLFRLTLTGHLPVDWWWVGPTNPADNRGDGTGMTLEVALFDGPPGDPSHGQFGDFAGVLPWDHEDRFHAWTATLSGGFQYVSEVGGADTLLAGVEVWLLAQQWPNGDIGTLPFDPYISWDPTADMGSFVDADSNPQPAPWDLTTIVEVPMPVPPDLWGP